MSVAEEFDLGEQSAPADRLGLLRQQVGTAKKLMADIEVMEDNLKKAKAELHTLRSRSIPDTMLEAGMAETTMDGQRIVINDFVSGTLPKEPAARAKAIEWLTANDGAGLIKTEVEVSFGRSQHNEALDLAEKIRKEGHVVAVNEGVHPQTLAKFARDRLAAGEKIDFETLGLYTGKVADFKEPKKK